MIFPQLFPCSNYKIFPNIPRQQWGFDDSPVVATGHFLLQGYMTVQRAHCAVQCSAVQPVARAVVRPNQGISGSPQHALSSIISQPPSILPIN